jgi:hypothetical protein
MYTVTSNSDALSIRFRQRAVALTHAVLAAEHANAQAAYRQAQRLSSGSVPSSYLRRAARQRGAGLYSRRSPAPPGPPEVINAQTTRLKRSWRYYVAWKGDGSQVTLWNTAPYARAMRGTSRMMSRPILEKVAALERMPRLERLHRAQIAAMQKR